LNFVAETILSQHSCGVEYPFPGCTYIRFIWLEDRNHSSRLKVHVLGYYTFTESEESSYLCKIQTNFSFLLSKHSIYLSHDYHQNLQNKRAWNTMLIQL